VDLLTVNADVARSLYGQTHRARADDSDDLHDDVTADDDALTLVASED
jgi:hypothetical protein